MNDVLATPTTSLTARGPHANATPVRDSLQPEYTCPMHPQVRQVGPGACPICGMSLEPVVASVQAGASPDLGT